MSKLHHPTNLLVERLRCRINCQSATKMTQRLTFMQCYVIGLIALDFVLRIIFARMMDVTLVIQIIRMHPYDTATDTSGL